MSSTTFYIIRHGETDQNKNKKIQGRLDYPLNEKGFSDAYKLGEYFKKNNMNFDVFVSSPLIRAIQTLTCIKEKIGSNEEIIIEEDMIERSFGESEGMPISKEIFIPILKDEGNGLEKSYEIQKRVTRCLLSLAKRYPDKKIIIVSHSHTIKGITTSLSKEYSFDDKLTNCSLSIFEVVNGVIEIKSFNNEVI